MLSISRSKITKWIANYDIPAEKNRVLFVSSPFLFPLFFFCLPHPHAKSEISSPSPLNFDLPLFSFFLLPLCVEKPRKSYNYAPLGLTGHMPKGKTEQIREARSFRPGHEVHGMTCSLALYQIHFTASSLSRCPVPSPGSRHRRDRCLTFAGESTNVYCPVHLPGYFV